MEKLVKPVDYAKMVGISRQAVYMKIKKGVIPSRTVDGKLYIVVDDSDDSTELTDDSYGVDKSGITDNSNFSKNDEVHSSGSYSELIRAKDETISILKETIADLKESNRLITTTLKSEVELLKDSFSEMKKLYTLQIEHITNRDMMEVEDVEAYEAYEWLSLDEWISANNISDKKVKKILKRVKKMHKKGSSDIKLEDGQYYISNTFSSDEILG